VPCDIRPAPLLASAGYLIRQAWKQKRATAMQRSNTPAKPLNNAQIVRVFYCQNKAATCAAYWLHLHCVITVNIRGVVAPQVLL